MGIALFTLGGLMAPLQGLAQWLGSARSSRRVVPVARPAAAARIAPRMHTWPAAACSRAEKPRRPVRVVRVIDPSQAKAGAGRMLISGRMADVCAELERLAALEAAAG
jgi:hypothetical protein